MGAINQLLAFFLAIEGPQTASLISLPTFISWKGIIGWRHVLRGRKGLIEIGLAPSQAPSRAPVVEVTS